MGPELMTLECATTARSTVRTSDFMKEQREDHARMDQPKNKWKEMAAAWIGKRLKDRNSIEKEEYIYLVVNEPLAPGKYYLNANPFKGDNDSRPDFRLSVKEEIKELSEDIPF